MSLGITGKSQARQIQRKLTTIVRSLQQYPEIQVIYDALEERSVRSKRKSEEPHANMLQFMFDETMQTGYIDDVTMFAKDIDMAIAAFVKKTGDKLTAQSFSSAANALLMEHFGLSLTEIPISSEPTKEEKAAMRNIITSLMRHEHSAPFVHPIKEKDYPEYFQTVTNPMDLTTVKKTVTHCTIEEFVANIDLIWSNCMMVNKKRSEIYQWAVDMKKYSDQLIQEAFPSLSTNAEESQVEPIRSKKRKSEQLEDDEKVEEPNQPEKDLKAFKMILKTLQSHELSPPFHYPVDGVMFPDYYEKIARPIDYSTIKLRIKSYDRKSFYEDLCRVYSNCMVYNLPGSDIYNQAKEMQRVTDDVIIAQLGGLPETPAAGVKSRKKAAKVEELAIAPAKSSANDDEKALKKILKAVQGHELATPFQYPVDGSLFPDYYKKITKPVDFSAIKNQLKTYDRVSFYDDLNRVYTNCMEYNLPGSDIYEQAKELQKYTNDQFVSVFGEIPNSAAALKSARDGDMKVLKDILHALYAIPTSLPFHYPVDSSLFPDYYEKIEHPIDYSTIKKNIKSYNRFSFYADINRVYTNCMEYNIPGSDIYKQAKEMQKLTNAEFISHFGSLPLDVSLVQTVASSTGQRTNDPQGSNDDVKSFKKILKTLMANVNSEPFHYPVDSSIFPDYYEKISKPIDYSAMKANIKSYDRQSFYEDLCLICSNCMDYNVPGSDIYKQAQNMQQEINLLYSTYFGDVPQHKRRKERRTKSEGEAAVVTEKSEKKAASRRPKLENIKTVISNLSIEKLSQMAEQLKNNDDSSIIQRCKAEAEHHTAKFAVPHTVENHTIINYGEVTGKPAEVVCPNNFSSSSAFRLYFDVLDEANITDCLYSDLMFDVDVTHVDHAVYVTASSLNQHIVTTCSADTVMDYLFDHPKHILNLLSHAMYRCYGVFNVICSMDTIGPFLEPITDDLYFSHIKTPICLRDIHDKFATYESIFDFCFDMKLVFYNCMRYNKNTSVLYRHAASILSTFDALFCHWVLNVQCVKEQGKDMTVSVAPGGPWDDWQYLKYFDNDGKNTSKCAVTGVELPEDELLFCDACENQYCHDIVVGTKEGRKWFCPRCSQARAAHYTSFKLDSAAVKAHFAPISNNQNVHEFVSSTSQDPLGWYQNSADHSFMDAFGSVYLELNASDVYESKATYQTKLQDREVELKDNKRRSKKRTSSSLPPQGYRTSSFDSFTWYNVAHKEIVDSSGVMSPFRHTVIRQLIEGLPGFAEVGRYSQFERVKQSITEELNAQLEKVEKKRVNYEALQGAIRKEKDYWLPYEVNFDNILTNPPPYVPQNHPQLSQYLHTFELNASMPFSTIVHLFDVIAAASSVMGYVCVGMWDLVECLSPAEHLSPSTIQFDELCCTLGNFLIHDLRQSLAMSDELPFHKMLMAYCMNILTWNHSIVDILCILILMKLKKYDVEHVLAHMSMAQSLDQRVIMIILVTVLSYVDMSTRHTNKLLHLWTNRSTVNDFLVALFHIIDGDEAAVTMVKRMLINYEKCVDINSDYFHPPSRETSEVEPEQMDVVEPEKISSERETSSPADTGTEAAHPESHEDESEMKVVEGAADEASSPTPEDPTLLLATRVERMLRCALLRDSDTYTTEERIDILTVLTEFVSTTSLYREHRYKTPPLPTADSHIALLSAELHVAPHTGKTCPLTNLSGDDTDEEWVVVPDYLLAAPTLELPNIKQLYKKTQENSNPAPESNSVSETPEIQFAIPLISDDTLVSPRRVVLAVAAMREEARIAVTSRATNQRGAILSLGEDHYKNKYFFLSAQAHMYLNGIHTRNVSEPLLFVYTMGKVHTVNCNHIPPVYQSLSNSYPCEYLLKYTMQTHFTVIKKSLINLQALKTANAAFVGNPNAVATYCERQARLQHTLLSKLTSLEVEYLRCVEYRTSLYYAFINNSIAEVKKRYLRNVISDGLCEVDSTNGYLFRDYYNGVRMLNANTVASKLLSEPAYLEVLQGQLKRNKIRLYTKSNAGLIAPKSQYMKAKGSSGMIDESSGFRPMEDEPGESGRGGKPVEQLHITSGTVLRRYASGRDAAMLMEVSQSGISLCCKGIKADAFGFKWRFYEEPAPPINPVAIEILKSLKRGHNKPSPLPLPSSVDAGQYPRRHQSDLVPSSVLVNYRLLKLKIEVLNMIAILPFWNFEWPAAADNEISMQPKTSNKDYDTNSIASGDVSDAIAMEVVSDDATEKSHDVPISAANSSGEHSDENSGISEKGDSEDDDASESDEDIENKDAESEEQSETTAVTTRSGAVAHATRHPVAHAEEFQQFQREIQAASTPLQLLQCLWKLTSIIPRAYFATPPKRVEYALCVADVANYLYTIDRSLRYEDITLDLKYEHIDYRPRTNNSAKCLLSSSCVKAVGHMSRCMGGPLADGYSRYSEFGHLKQLTQKDEPKVGRSVGWAPPVHRPLIAPTAVPQHLPQQVLISDIQFVQPFVPRLEDVKETAWV